MKPHPTNLQDQFLKSTRIIRVIMIYLLYLDNKLYSDEVFNYETKNTYQIEVNYTSNILNSLTSIVTVEINDVNEIFELSISNNNIDENKEEGSVVGDFITDDEDVLALHNYELVEGFGDSDNNLFKVEDEKLITNVVFDYEDTRKSFTVRVKSTSLPNEYTFENYFIINVNNLPDQIVDLNISSLSNNENQPKETLVGILSTNDEFSSATHSYELINGEGDEDNNLFKITEIIYLLTQFDMKVKTE